MIGNQDETGIKIFTPAVQLKANHTVKSAFLALAQHTVLASIFRIEQKGWDEPVSDYLNRPSVVLAKIFGEKLHMGTPLIL